MIIRKEMKSVTKGTFKLYLRYKAWRFRRSIFGSGKSMKRLRVWWQIYSVMFVAIVLAYVMRPHTGYLWFAAVSLVVMIFISIAKDYKSGAHVHWNRKVRYSNGDGKEEDNNR